MKKIIAMAVMLAASAPLAAQIQKGDNFAEVSAGFFFDNNKDDVAYTNTQGDITWKKQDMSQKSITLSISDSYFVTRNIAVGVSFGYGFSRNEQSADISNEGGSESLSETNKSNMLIFGAHAAYYGQIAPRLYFTGTGRISYRNNKMERNSKQVITQEGLPTIERSHAYDTKMNGFVFAMTPGLTWFVTNRMALTTSVGSISYETYDTDRNDLTTGTGTPGISTTVNESRSGFDVSFTHFSFGIGFRF